MEAQLRIAGGLLLALAGMHGIFPRYFDWKEGLKSLSLINRQIMSIHTVFIALGVGLMGLLCLVAAPDLVHTPLGKTVCTGLGFFWGVRLLVQFWGYSPELWRGRRLETSIHIMFIVLWGYFAGIFLWTGMN